MSQQSESAIAFLAGDATQPPVCMQIYLGLYLEPARQAALADIYRDLLDEGDDIQVSPEQVLSIEMDAWERAWSRLHNPPAWMPMRIPHAPAAPATVRREGQRLLYRVGDGAERDLDDATTSSDRDVWDRREESEFNADPEKLIPTWDATDDYLRTETETGARTLQRWGDAHLLHAHMGMPYWSCYSALGFAGLMESMHGNPDLLAALIERATHNALERVKLVAASGARCLFIEECLCSSDMISENDYLRFSYPAAEAVLTAARDAGLRTVYYFCGGIEGRLGHLARLPADALAFEEGKKGFDIDLARVRDVVGEGRPLLGNIDVTVIRDGNGSGINRAVQDQREAAGPLLATSCGSPLTLDTPPEKLDAMVRATRQLTAANDG